MVQKLQLNTRSVFVKLLFIIIYGAVNFANAKTTFPKSLYLCKAEEKFLSDFGRK